MTRLRCPDCDNQVFNIHIPPNITAKREQFLYVVCDKCGKLWRIKAIKLNQGYVSKAELEPMVKV